LRASDSIIEALYSKVPVITNKHGSQKPGGPDSIYIEPNNPGGTSRKKGTLDSNKDD
jgi:hypothetical protein